MNEVIVDKIGVHRTHCCLLHGCKYGQDDTCPVVQQDVVQDYVCEDCIDYGIEYVDQVESMFNSYIKSCPNCGGVL